MFSHHLRTSAVVATAALAVSVLGTSAAEAKPTRPGTPTVTASATEPAIGTYDLTASWTAVSGATGYRATVTRSGTTLASATLNATSWNPHVAATPGQQLTVSVKAVINRKPGRAGTKTFTLTDQIAPTASYTSSWDNNTGTATLQEVGLTDDSPVSGVTRTVDWGDGTSTTYAAGAAITHNYGLKEWRYVPMVTLKDATGNKSPQPVEAPAVVIRDTEAPTGSFAVTPGSAWAKYSTVTLTQSALSDNWSPAANITRSVDWGDGTITAWTTTGPLTHRYTAVGQYTPTVTITDEAHNAADVPTSLVTVTADTVAPTVRLTLPAHRHSVKAWRTLRGRATDAGTGVKSVWLKAVEKRGHAWYGYVAKTHTWAKATTKAKAFGKARAFTLSTGATHRWAARLVGLRKGTLVYKVKATDQVGNTSALLSHLAKLTRR